MKLFSLFLSSVGLLLKAACTAAICVSCLGPTTRAESTTTQAESRAGAKRQGARAGALALGVRHTCILDFDGVQCWGDDTVGQTDVPALHHPTAVSAGGFHSCALDDEAVHCWGYDDFGQTDAPTLHHPVEVSAGGDHTCALDDDGVRCWGANNFGQTNTPVLRHPTEVATGTYHTCAVDDDGVHCWGSNGYGQARVPALHHPTAVGTGGDHTCAVDDDGVHCWGDGTYGQTSVPPLHHPTAIRAGGDHTCALDDDGVHCWGDDRFGQTNVPPLHHPMQLDAGEHHTCAFDDDGVHCWGSNSVGQSTVPSELELLGRHACAVVGGQVRCVGHNELGQLGLGHDADVSVPVVKTRPSDLGLAFEPVEEVALGRSFSCALNTRGAVKCWGRNVSGQLGLGDTRNRGAGVDDMGDRLPMLVFGESRAGMAKLALGEDHACALSNGNELFCWGKGSSGALGTEATQDVGTTGGAAKVHLRKGLVVGELALGEAHTCLLDADGMVYCFGRNDVGQLGLGHSNNVGDVPGSLGEAMQPVRLGAGFAVQSIASGRHHVCALSRAGAVKCWGANDVGQLGLGDTRGRGTSMTDMGDALPALDFGHGQVVVGLDCGLRHCCIRTIQNTIKCWGDNSKGQLGLGDHLPRGTTASSMGDALPFVMTPAGEAVVSIRLDGDRTCARTNTGLRCWGRNGGGELGLGDREDRGGSPQTIPRLLAPLGI